MINLIEEEFFNLNIKESKEVNKIEIIQNNEYTEYTNLMNTQKNPINYLSKVNDLGERIFNNFIYEISEFLSKKEKIQLREISEKFEETIFSQFQINIKLKKRSEFEDFNSKNFDLKKIFKFYNKVEILKIESIWINKEHLELLDFIVERNYKLIKSLSFSNLQYDCYESIEKLFLIYNKLSYLNEININCTSNREKLFLHLEKNDKKFTFFNKIKKLSIINCPLPQLLFILQHFPNVEDLNIESCSLDEEFTKVTDCILKINKNNKTNTSLNYNTNGYISLNLSFNGFSSTIALDSVKLILESNLNLENLELKGLWFTTIIPLSSSLSKLSKLKNFNVMSSKYLFSHYNLSSEIIFASFDNLTILDISDARVKDLTLLEIFNNFSAKLSNTLEELNLMKNMISHEGVQILVNNCQKIKNLKILDLGFNQQIRNKGFNIFVDNVKKFNLKKIDFRGCCICISISYGKIINLVCTKGCSLETVILYFSIMKEADYNTLFKKVYSQIKVIPGEKRLNVLLKVEKVRIREGSKEVKDGKESKNKENKDNKDNILNLADILYRQKNLVLR